MIGSLITRALRFNEPIEFVAGADYASDTPTSQSYPTKNSMSAMAAFPWVRACVLAKADDLSGLKVRVMRNGEAVENHPLSAILIQPASRTTWREWCRQAVVDYELSGNHYSLIAGGVSLLRMHPNKTNPVPQPDGQVQGYRYEANGKTYAWEDVLHVRNASWSDGIESIGGEGSIRALHADLTAELAAKTMAAETAKRGRLEGVFTPKDSETAWGPERISKFKKAISAWAKEASGYLILGGAAEFQIVSATPRDMEFSAQRGDTRDATLATFSVPPARLSLPTANFSTQQQQMRTYWESLRGGPASALADALTWLARRLGQPGDAVAFDFSEIEALQEGATERLTRVNIHIANGIDPVVAYQMEGIEVPEGGFITFEPAVPAPEPAARSLPSNEMQRMDIWRGFLNAVHAPSENAIRIATMRYLRDAAKRYAKRLAANEKSFTKQLSDAQIVSILAESAEREAFTAALEGPMRAALLRAFRASTMRMGVSLTWDPAGSILHEATREAAVHITETQSNVLRSLLSMLNQGATVNEVQDSLIRSHAFSATRALRIARTEATRFVNAGADQAYSQAADEGISVKKQWLTARDGHVRQAHRSLDGQTVEVGERFTASGGQRASFPGGFGSAALDANCRCTTIPVLGDDS